MKRFSKIFVVVLAVSLIFGTLAMTASAKADPTTGMYHKLHDVYDDKTVGLAGSNASVPSGFTWTQNNFNKSNVEAWITEGENGNKYMLYKSDVSIAATGNPYFGTGYGGKNIGQGTRPTYDKASDTITPNNSVTEKTPFVVINFDIMSPTGNFLGMNTSMEMRYFGNTTGATPDGIDVLTLLDEKGNNVNNNSMIVETLDGVSYIYLKGDLEGTKKEINPYEFTRITQVWEGVDNPDPNKHDAANLYIYVNDEFWVKRCAVFPKETTFTGDKPVVSWDELRMNFAPTTDATKTLAVDNFSMYCAGLSYLTNGGNLGTILDAETDLKGYDGYAVHSANQGAIPFGTAIAQVGETKYDNFNEALAAVEDGGTLALLHDVVGTVNVDKEMTITTNGYSIDIEPGEDLGVNTLEDGVITIENIAGKTVNITWDDCLCDDDHYGDADVPDAAFHPLFNNADVALYTKLSDVYNPTFEGLIDGVTKVLVGWELDGVLLDKDAIVTPEILELEYATLTPVYSEYVEITWKDTDGTVLGTSRALQGTTATVPSDLVGKVEVEGFLRSLPTAWDNLEIPADATSVVITAAEDCERTIYASVEFMFNVREQFNLLILACAPVPEEGSGVTVSEFYLNTTARWTASNTATVKINGKTYKQAQGWLGNDVACKTEKITFKLVFTYNEVEYTYETYTSLASYAQTILDTEGYSEDAKDYAVNLANFYQALCVARNATAANTQYAAFKAIVDNNTERVISIDPATAAKVADPETFAKYVASIQLTFESYHTKYVVTYTAEGAALAGAENLTRQGARPSDMNRLWLEFGDTYSTTFSLENLIAYSYGTFNEATMNYVLAMYGYVQAHIAYNS